MMLYLISYDIVDDDRRLQVARILLDSGQRVQYSVFEARVDPGSLTTLKEQLRAAIDEEEDSIRVYRICRDCEKCLDILGRGEHTEPPGVYIL